MSGKRVGHGDRVIGPDEAKRWRIKCLCRSLASHVTVVDLLRQLEGGLSHETQLWFTEECIRDPLYSIFSKNRQFERRLLKGVIQASEEDGFSIHDELMAEFSAALIVNKDFPELQGSSSEGQSLESLCCKLYAYCRHGSCDEPPWVQVDNCEETHVLESLEGLPQQSSDGLPSTYGTASKGIIAISVSRDILAGGTGCHEWEAGFCLAEFVLNNPTIFKDASVLELGCGVGLVGIALSRVQPARILCTDGNEDTIINCHRNFNLNGQKIGDQYSSNDWISVQKYAWEQDLSELLPATRSGPTPLDIVVGSDLLYDPESFPSLVRLLMQLLTVGGAHTAYLACTRRNDETLKSFEQLLEAEEGIIVVKTTFPAFELDNSVRFCHVPSLEAARQCIVFYKIKFLPN